MLKNRILFVFLVLTATLTFHLLTVHAQSYSVKPIVHEGELIGDSNLMITRVITSYLAINNNGDLVFLADLTNVSMASDYRGRGGYTLFRG